MPGLVEPLTKWAPIWKSVDFTGAATTTTIWTPTTSTRIVLTGLDISCGGVATSTIMVFFGKGTGSWAPQRVFMGAIGTTSVLSLRYNGLESKYDIILSAVSSGASAFTVNAQGFELP